MELLKIKKKDILSNVRIENGLYSLNDLFELTDKKKNTDPRTWLRQDNVQNLITVASDFLNVSSNHIIKSKRGFLQSFIFRDI